MARWQMPVCLLSHFTPSAFTNNSPLPSLVQLALSCPFFLPNSSAGYSQFSFPARSKFNKRAEYLVSHGLLQMEMRESGSKKTCGKTISISYAFSDILN